MKRYAKIIITTMLFLAVLLPSHVFAQQNVTGYVFLDTNRDGQRGPSERGLAKFGVSNGRQIVLTDNAGKYELPIDDDDIIFVIKPRDYMTPVNDNNIPQFYYIHKPAGSPDDLKGLGIAPTGPLPESVDFALYERPEKNKFNVIYFGDPQPGNIKEVDIMTHDVIEEVVGTKQAVFGVSLGDLAEEIVSEEYDQSIGTIGLPWYNVIGNHDHYESDPAASTNEIGDDRFQRRYGPATYSYNYGPVHFIMIDNITAVWDEEAGRSTYWTEYTQETLEFIKNDLSLVPKDKLVVLMFHIAFPGGNSEDVFALLKDRPNTLSLAGHGHEIIQHFFGKEQGWPNDNEHHHIETGAICGIHWLGPTDEYGIPTATMHCGSPNGYTTVYFDGNKYRTSFKAARRDADFQMHIFAPSEIKSPESADTEVVVNVFWGSERSVTEMKIGEDGQWTEMRREVRHDPYLVSTVPTGHPLGNVRHIWVANLPANMPGGTYVMYFRSKDMFGKTSYGKRIIRVKDPNTYLKASPADMQWWRDMKFGMFIHWGPVSLKGTEIAWSRAGHRPGTGGTGSIPVETYDNLNKKFNPVEFDAEQWAQIAKDAGMKYIVFVSKTHDGFCMFDTKLTEHKITNSPFNRDVAKELSLACQKAGLRFGFYYSPPDWHHPDFRTDNHDRYIEYMHGQIRELCTNYGKIDIIWFDGLHGTSEDWDSETMFEIIRKLQPHVIINDRAGLEADYGTPEQTIGGFSMDRAWETCMTLGDQWAWKPNDNIKSLKQCIDNLVIATGGDGNFLFNTGPMPTGRIEARQAKRFRQMGQWLKKYGRSIYGTRGGPFMPGPWGVSTRKGSTIYIHVLKWLKRPLELPAIDRKILSASVLTGGNVKVDQTAEGIVFDADKKARESMDTIIALKLDETAMTIEPISTVPRSITAGKKAATSNIYRDMEEEYGPQNAVDASYSTRWATDDGLRKAWLEVDLEEAVTFDRAVIKEGYGELVQKFELQYKDGNTWKTFHHGSKIGEMFEVEFAPVTARIVRLNILDTVNGGPTIWEFLLFKTKK